MATVHSMTSSSPKASKPATKKFHGRLKVDAKFCPTDVEDLFSTVDWEVRSSQIKGENGELIFEQTNCEVPSFWSQLATNVICSKYFYGEVGTPEREYSVRQLIHRVARTITDWGLEDGYFATPADGERFYRELAWLCLHQHGAFNSPVWFNVGLYHQYGVSGAKCNWRWDAQAQDVVQPENPYEYPQGSACFIQHVDDNMEDIMELARSEAMLFKFGSGTGTDLTTLRSHREKLAGGGKPSGPLSFMRVYDQIAAVVKSGGKTRRAAKMQSLKVWHPDVMEFIECKWKEEKKAHILIQKGGYDSNFNGEAYSSIMFQNANLSVRVTDDFMQAVEKNEDWTTHWVTNPKQPGPTYPAREIMDRMADCAWHCGDPGVQYDTTINKWHTCPNSGRINASNPCSEYMFLDDTACNLASINLMKFRKADGTFEAEGFKAACRIYFIAQEILVDHASYPTPDIARNSHLFRPLGLGYSNLGSLLMTTGIPYDSHEAYGMCGAVTSLLHGAANLTSSELAEAVGPFDTYETNAEPMLRVMQMHRDAVEEIDPNCPAYMRDAARRIVGRCPRRRPRARLPQRASHRARPHRHDQLHDGLRYHRHRARYRPREVQAACRRRHAQDRQPNRAARAQHARLRSAANRLDPRLHQRARHDRRLARCEGRAPRRVRLCVPTAKWETLDRLASPRLHDGRRPTIPLGAISKTVNMPRDTTTEDIAKAYFDGWKLGLKALAIYRDGSKESQPLSTSTEGDRAAANADGQAAPRTPGGYSPEHHPQVQRLRPRRLHHRRPLPRWPPRRVVPHDGQRRQHDRRPDGRLRHQRLDEPAIRRAPRRLRAASSATCASSPRVTPRTRTSASPKA